jgi:hypothetical protein
MLRIQEAADFVMFSDVDDFLVPKNGRSFVDELQELSRRHPLAAGFVYPRFNADFQSGALLSEIFRFMGFLWNPETV